MGKLKFGWHGDWEGWGGCGGGEFGGWCDDQ